MGYPRFHILLLQVFLFVQSGVAVASQPTSHITVIGSVFCDVCHNNSFTKHSYFLPGVDVHVQCKFQASEPRTTEQITFSVNRTTNRYGIYKLDIPSIDGVDCVDSLAIQSFCQASLIGSSFTGCNVPGVSTTSKEITVKSRQTNLCIYSVSALSYRPSKRNSTLCGNYNNNQDQDMQELLSDSFNSSKFFLPYFPPYVFPWPLPQFPPFPQLPPFPPFPSFPPLPPLPQLPPFPPFPPFQFPPLPPLPPLQPYPFPTTPPQPPSLPFPFPPLPPFTSRPPQIPSPPAFNLGDPRTWIPKNPSSSPPPPLSSSYDPNDPRTWIPYNPFLAPPPPEFNIRDPRTWIPNFPPSPPTNPQVHQP